MGKSDVSNDSLFSFLHDWSTQLLDGVSTVSVNFKLSITSYVIFGDFLLPPPINVPRKFVFEAVTIMDPLLGGAEGPRYDLFRKSHLSSQVPYSTMELFDLPLIGLIDRCYYHFCCYYFYNFQQGMVYIALKIFHSHSLEEKYRLTQIISFSTPGRVHQNRANIIPPRSHGCRS